MSAHAREARFREMLIESVQLLAADFDAQVAALPAFVVVADEVALTFDDCYQLLDQIVAAGLLE
jgi:hypothetical protein